MTSTLITAAETRATTAVQETQLYTQIEIFLNFDRSYTFVYTPF